MWTRVVDANNLYEFLSHNVEHSARRDIVNILTHERFKFNWENPTGHYRLEMDKKVRALDVLLSSMSFFETSKRFCCRVDGFPCFDAYSYKRCAFSLAGLGNQCCLWCERAYEFKRKHPTEK